MRYLLSFLMLSLFVFTACSDHQEQVANPVSYPDIFNKVLDAHGGKKTWDAMNTLRYTRGTGANAEYHTIDLKNRKSIIEVKGKYKLGSDGKNVWVSPHRDSFPGKSPRFTHNLHFYFFAIPFVFTDPGVNIADAGKVTVDSMEYHLLEVTFGENVGDAPDDRYNMYINPETYTVEFITYSVTYFDSSRATSYNALKYDWKEANGLLAPSKYVGYKWERDQFGDQRYESVFSDQSYQIEKKQATLFDIPEGAFIDSEAQ